MARREAEAHAAGGAAADADEEDGDADDDADGGAEVELDDMSNELEPFQASGATAGFGAPEWAAAGNTLGIAIDMNAGTISMSMNGSFERPWGVAYRNVRPGPMGLTPAVAIRAGMAVRFNIG